MFNIIIGLILLFIALGVLIFLVFWSHQTIEFIHKHKPQSAREILKNLHAKR